MSHFIIVFECFLVCNIMPSSVLLHGNRKKLFTKKLRLLEKGETFERDNKGNLRMSLKFGQVMEDILMTSFDG